MDATSTLEKERDLKYSQARRVCNQNRAYTHEGISIRPLLLESFRYYYVLATQVYMLLRGCFDARNRVSLAWLMESAVKTGALTVCTARGAAQSHSSIVMH